MKARSHIGLGLGSVASDTKNHVPQNDQQYDFDQQGGCDFKAERSRFHSHVDHESVEINRYNALENAYQQETCGLSGRIISPVLHQDVASIRPDGISVCAACSATQTGSGNHPFGDRQQSVIAIKPNNITAF